MLDVGQGDSFLFTTSGKTMLIDTGGGFSSNLTDYVFLPFFKAHGITKIDTLLLTHGDYDHMGEAISLVNKFKVGNVIFNRGEYNDLELDLIKVLEEKNIPYYQNGKEFHLGNYKFYFLNDQLYNNENDNSTVLYTNFNEMKLLLMGDAGVEVEKNLMTKYNLKNIDILKVGHHGSKTSSSREFIEYIHSKYFLISVGKDNRYGHPDEEVLDILRSSSTYRTDRDGSVRFRKKRGKVIVETCVP